MVRGHVPDQGQGEREDRGQASQTHAEGRHKGLAKTFTNPRSAGLCFPEGEGGGVWPRKTYPRLAILPAPQTLKCASHGDCGWLFLAWVSPLFQVTQAEPGLLEGED